MLVRRRPRQSFQNVPFEARATANMFEGEVEMFFCLLRFVELVLKQLSEGVVCSSQTVWFFNERDQLQEHCRRFVVFRERLVGICELLEKLDVEGVAVA